MRVEVREAITFTWLVLAAFYAITAFGAKKPVREESGASRLYHTLLMGTVFGLLFSQHFRIAQLGLRIVTSPEAAYTGLALVVAGAAFAIWARFTLGGNWSARVTVKEDHSLVHRGPYRAVRHPIYAGALLAMLGTALAEGEAGCFLAVVLAFLVWWLKARMEEEFMTQQFGEKYRHYRRTTRQFIPFLL